MEGGLKRSLHSPLYKTEKALVVSMEGWGAGFQILLVSLSAVSSDKAPRPRGCFSGTGSWAQFPGSWRGILPRFPPVSSALSCERPGYFSNCLFSNLKDDVIKLLLIRSANLGNSAVAKGLEKFSFHSNPKEGQCQRMFKLPHNCTHFTC